MPSADDGRRSALLGAELEDLELDDEDLEAAGELAEQIQAAALAVAGSAGEDAPLLVSAVTRELATRAIDEEIEEDRAAGAGPACTAGCAACCHIPVSVTAADVAALLVWLVDQDEVVQQDVIDRIEEALPRVMGEEPRGALPCPILDLESLTCRAYEVRPLACRGCFSDDASQCIPGGTISAFVVPQVISRSAAVGVRLALAEIGEDHGCADLIVGLAHAIANAAE